MIKKDVPSPRVPDKADEESKSFFTNILQIIKDLRIEVAQTGEWINVTYLNSWVDFNTTYFSVGYLKDVYGYVHLRGYCKSGTTANPFTLPIGFRPEKSIIIPVYSVPSGTTVVPSVTISNAGVVTLANYSNSGVSFDGIVYQAV
jgi:hypothetical protein